MMDIAILIVSGMLTVSGPSGQPLDSAERVQIRCRPAPYFVADRAERAKPQRTILTGTRVPIRAQQERRARPCHLMQAPTTQPANGFMRVAD